MKKKYSRSPEIAYTGYCKTEFGVFEVYMNLGRRHYTYYLTSEYKFRVFLSKIRKNRPGSALDYLTKNNSKELHLKGSNNVQESTN